MIRNRAALTLCVIGIASSVSAEGSGIEFVPMEAEHEKWTVFELAPPAPTNDMYRVFVSPQAEFVIVPQHDSSTYCPPTCFDPRLCECVGGGTPWGRTTPSSIDRFSFDYSTDAEGLVDPESIQGKVMQYRLIQPD